MGGTLGKAVTKDDVYTRLYHFVAPAAARFEVGTESLDELAGLWIDGGYAAWAATAVTTLSGDDPVGALA